MIDSSNKFHMQVFSLVNDTCITAKTPNVMTVNIITATFAKPRTSFLTSLPPTNRTSCVIIMPSWATWHFSFRLQTHGCGFVFAVVQTVKAVSHKLYLSRLESSCSFLTDD